MIFNLDEVLIIISVEWLYIYICVCIFMYVINYVQKIQKYCCTGIIVDLAGSKIMEHADRDAYFN